MSLPETVCISVQAPQNLLDLQGYHWGDDIIFDSTSGGLDPDAGFKQSTVYLKLVVEALVGKCGFQPRELILFGYGQGGLAALNLAGMLRPSAFTCLTRSHDLQCRCTSRPSRAHPASLEVWSA